MVVGVGDEDVAAILPQHDRARVRERHADEETRRAFLAIPEVAALMEDAACC